MSLHMEAVSVDPSVGISGDFTVISPSLLTFFLVSEVVVT